MWVQVPSSARKTQVERLEPFCVIEKIAIDVESLVIEVMVLELSNMLKERESMSKFDNIRFSLSCSLLSMEFR